MVERSSRKNKIHRLSLLMYIDLACVVDLSQQLNYSFFALTRSAPEEGLKIIYYSYSLYKQICRWWTNRVMPL